MRKMSIMSERIDISERGEHTRKKCGKCSKIIALILLHADSFRNGKEIPER